MALFSKTLWQFESYFTLEIIQVRYSHEYILITVKAAARFVICVYISYTAA